jgi:hypothetical protein
VGENILVRLQGVTNMGSFPLMLLLFKFFFSLGAGNSRDRVLLP